MAKAIGALRVDLSVNTAAFKKGLDEARGRMRSFAASAKKHAAIAAAAFAAAAAAFGVAVRKIVNEMDKLTKLSQQIGVPVKQLSALKHAAELSGVSIDELGRAFRNVARNAQGAARGPTDFSRALDALGVSWRDANGQFVRADQLLIAVADKFVGMQDGAGKTALAMKIFGEEMGPRLIPLLNQGSAGIRAMTEEARELGLTFDTETGRRAEAFNDALTRVNAAVRGVLVQMASQLLPVMQQLSEMFVNFTKDNLGLVNCPDFLGGWLV